MKKSLEEAIKALRAERKLNEDNVEQAAEDAVIDATNNNPKIDTEKVVDDIAEIANELDISADEVYNANGNIERNLEHALKVARREKRNNGKE